MWITREEALSDFVLAGATAVLGWIVPSYLARLGFYPSQGLLAELLLLGWLFALTGLVPLLLARYRKQGAAAFGLDGERAGMRAGILLAIPVGAVGVIALWTGSLGNAPLPLERAALGLLGLGSSALGLLLLAARVAVVGAGSVLLLAFLTVRARDGFRGTPVSQLEALRTYGLGAVGAAAVLGLLAVVAGAVGAIGLLVTLAALVAAVLLTDRLLVQGGETARATVLAPAIVAFLIRFETQTGGFLAGLFGPRLLLGLYAGCVAAALVIVVAVLVETRVYAWAVVPLLVATALYPSPLTPTPVLG